ncbi:MAG: carbohydrate ABC transporter permease [Clostridia bacterium]|nr:carbohydrate ABC transporter permease [Clostridia bacterium]
MVVQADVMQAKKQAERRKRINTGLMLALSVALMLVFLAPLYISFTTSLKSKPELAKNVLGLPRQLYWANYSEAMVRSNFLRSLMNSCIVTFPSVALLVVMSSMGGYAIARFGKERKAIGMMDRIYLAALMIPFQILMIPVYRLYRMLGLQNNLLGVLIMLTGNSMAYSTFLYVGFIKSVPRELEEAALVDGCGTFRAYWTIVFPLLKPITATVAALHIMWHWNDFNISMILLQRDEVRPLTVKQFYFFAEYNKDYPVAFAAAIMSMIPVMLFFSFMQKYIVSGIAAGAVKG